MNSHVKIPPLKIILGVDGSEHSRAAIDLLCDLPAQPGSMVMATAVFSPRQLEMHSSLQSELQETCRRLSRKGWKTQSELKTGSPAETLIDLAEMNRADLIVLGAKGLRATLGILLGGVAQQVVEYGKWPVLVVRSPYKKIKTILLATDGSECSQITARFLANFPLPENVKIHTVYVMPPSIAQSYNANSWVTATDPLPVFPPGMSSAEIASLEEEEEKKGNALLASTSQHLQTNGLNTQVALLRGDAASEIMWYAQENQVDLIVCGSRGLSAVSGWLLGSVSRKLIHYSGCSVLVVRENI